MIRILFCVLLFLPTLVSAEANIDEKNYTLSCHKAGDIEVGMQVMKFMGLSVRIIGS